MSTIHTQFKTCTFLSFNLIFSRMQATLYHPSAAPQLIAEDKLRNPGQTAEFSMIQDVVPKILECRSGLVDVLASGEGYIIYSVFDYEGEINLPAMDAVSRLTNISFDIENQDEILKGPILIVLSETLI